MKLNDKLPNEIHFKIRKLRAESIEIGKANRDLGQDLDKIQHKD